MVFTCRCEKWSVHSGDCISVHVQMRGVVSARTWLLVGYLGLLHLMVMVSFTRRHDVNLDSLCAGWAGGATAARTHGLPGT